MNLEQLIDNKLELFSSDENGNGELITAIEERHQVLFDYLQAEYGEALNEAEYEMLLFPLFIILSCVVLFVSIYVKNKVLFNWTIACLFP